MASVKDFYKRKLLAAKDLKGKSITGKIIQVTPETTTGKDSDGTTKLVVELDTDDIRVQLNKTNALILCKELGEDYETWVGKKVKVSVIRTQFNNSPCDGLAVHKA